MTLAPVDIAIYAAGLFALFMTPGPVWVALLARALSGGFSAAWPLAAGVVVGDVLWPLLAILGVSLFVTQVEGALAVLRWIACVVFLLMGALILRNRDKDLASNDSLTRPGKLAGFTAGLAVILGNPKAILFYAGMLPGFFDLTGLTAADIAVICAISALVPLCGNLILAASIDRVRRLLSSPRAIRRTNTAAGTLLLAVGVAIPLL